MNPKGLNRKLIPLLLSIPLWGLSAEEVSRQTQTPEKPNIIFILADDLGFGDLGCYGQQEIPTPHIDSLATEGMRFTSHYSGSPESSPARASLLTGKDSGHSSIRANRNLDTEGQFPLPDHEMTVAELLQEQGYRTAAVGMWGLGGYGTTGMPLTQGFDRFFGYLCSRNAENYYPVYLWDDSKRIRLKNKDIPTHQPFMGTGEEIHEFDHFIGSQYSPDLMRREALEFIRQNQEEPFFLYWPTPVPHPALQVPPGSLKAHLSIEEEGPYLGYERYLPHPSPRTAYAAMVSRMDSDIGLLLKLLKELGLDENTLIFFSSDGTPGELGGIDRNYFNSVGELRGGKGTLFEGSIRVPLIARWKNRIPAGTTTDHIGSFQDFLPTLAELVGSELPENVTGLSYLPTLLAGERQELHETLYWETGGKIRTIRRGNWKAIQKHPFGSVELYNIAEDPYEQNDLAGKHRELAKELKLLMRKRRIPSSDFPMPGDRIHY